MWRTRPPRPAVALAAVLAAALVLLALPVAGARAALSNGDGWPASPPTLVAGGSPLGPVRGSARAARLTAARLGAR